jgi:hypothetical protein
LKYVIGGSFFSFSSNASFFFAITPLHSPYTFLLAALLLHQLLFTTMKLHFSLAILVGCSLSSSAFVAHPVATSKACTSSTSLFANSANIRAAMEATEKYGITSPEARLAWEGKDCESTLYSCVVMHKNVRAL